MNKLHRHATLNTWKDSSLSKLLKSDDLKRRLDGIWLKANEAYPRATWPGWIDHSVHHVLAVLRNLERLIPEYVYRDIREPEAFTLIVSVLLHDIGMIPEGTDGDGGAYARIRPTHGKRGADIIRSGFADFLQPFEYFLNPVCEIVANHQGEFNPESIPGLGYDLRADALWVRLADELDFGPHRAPQWLAELLKPGTNEIEHWKNHNKLYEPSIDLDHFRIQVRGTCSDTRIIPKLRHEIEEPSRQDIQKVFLNRGLKQQIGSRTFLLWDMTRFEGEAFKEELRQKQRELEDELARQRKLEGMRDSMVHMIVHDLRAPLTAVFNYLDLVREQEVGFISPESVQNLDLAMKASRWMVQMVNILLDASKIESGEMVLRIVECDVGEVLSDAIDAIRSLADEKNVLCHPAHVHAAIDRDAITRVVQNLVTNALKLTQPGGEVSVSLDSTERDLRVEITDQGPGIAAEHQSKIFEKFGQLDASVRQSIASSGLGLYFCKLAIEAHGGRIGVNSRVGQGSTFWFELPLRGPEQCGP